MECKIQGCLHVIHRCNFDEVERKPVQINVYYAQDQTRNMYLACGGGIAWNYAEISVKELVSLSLAIP